MVRAGGSWVNRSGGSGALAIPFTILTIAIIITINLYVPIIPQPFRSQVNNGVHTVTNTVSRVVTFTVDAAGRLKVEIKNVLNITATIANNPVIQVVATVHTKETQITGEELQATMRLLEVNFTAPTSNRQVVPDVTLFTWDFALASLPLGVVTLTADVILSIISCGPCANTTVMVPVDLQMTGTGGSAS